MTTKAQSLAPMFPLPANPATLRTCCQCGKPDHELPGPEDDPAKHFVQIELRHLAKMPGMERLDDQKNPLKILRLKRRGWRFIDRCVCHGQPAVDRMICMDCLNANVIAEQIHGEYRRTALRMERRQEQEPNFYAILCDADGGE